MLKRLTTLLAALMLLTFVAAGCGDDSEGGSSSSGDTAADTVATDATKTETDGRSTETAPSKADKTETEQDRPSDDSAKDDSGGAASPIVGEDAERRCKQSVSETKQFSEAARSKLSELCEKATSGDDGDRKEAAREVCETLVGESMPENAAGRDAALANCKNAGGQ